MNSSPPADPHPTACSTAACETCRFSSPDASDQPIVGSRVFVAVRSSEIRGAIEPRVFASFDSAILWCYCTHSLHRPHWQAFLTKFDPNGPLRMNQGGKARRARYVGWQQEMNDGTLMQLFEEEVKNQDGY